MGCRLGITVIDNEQQRNIGGGRGQKICDLISDITGHIYRTGKAN